MAAIAFDRRAVVVDGNVERVVARLFTVEEALPGAKPRIRALADALTPDARPGDFAQAMMDLGATICTPRSPACGLCPFREPCRARAEGTAETYPRKDKKAEGRLRRGAAFVLTRPDGALLARNRPPKGLLGGMTEVPGTPWSATFDLATALEHAPVEAPWRKLPGVVGHVFTHFPLELSVYRAEATVEAPADSFFLPPRDIPGAAFPTVFRKVLAHALER